MKSIGKYEVIAEIGTGGMGTIYRARDQVLDREVALKVLRTDADLDPDLRERFYREARACARLTHPNIIMVYDLGESGTDVYIAMELLFGRDLRKVLQENRVFSIAERLDVMIQVCDALEHAHGQQLVHRDIKPSNIFLCDDQRAKVLDFGIARMPTSNLTMAGKVLGSPNYMAPEQIRGGKCDSRSDLFSAAIVFCEFLVRSHPFQEEFIPRRIVASPPDSLRAKDPNVPEALEALLFRALEKDPDKRIRTAGEFAAGLRAILETVRASKPAQIPAASATPTPAATPSPMTPPARLSEATPAPSRLTPAAFEDAAEQRLSEFLRIVGDFDEGVDKHDRGAAEAALDRMRRLAAGDNRFVLAVSDCEARLKTMGAAPRVPAPPLPATVVSNVSPPPALRQVKPPEIPVPPRVAPPRVAPAPPVRPVAVDSKPKSNLILVATVAGIVILLAISVWLKSRGTGDKAGVVTTEPAVATATVSAAKSDLLDAPAASGKSLAALQQGQSVNVLAIPGPGDRDYTKVQAMVSGKPLPAGFARTADLSNWAGKSPEAAFSILELFAPADTAGEAELNTQLQKWNELVAQHPASPKSAAANLGVGRMEIGLAKLAKGSGKSEAEWRQHMDRARSALAKVSGSPELESQVAQLRAQLPQAGGVTPQAQSGTQTVTPQALSPERILRTRVNALWEDGKYQQAMQLVDQILAASPNHPDALRWKNKIRASQEAEARAQ